MRYVLPDDLVELDDIDDIKMSIDTADIDVPEEIELQNVEDELAEEPTAPEQGVDMGVADQLISAINDEWEAISKYNVLLTVVRDAQHDEMISAIEDIIAEENTHVGQLQALLQTISPNVSKIEDGTEEGKEDLEASQLNLESLKLTEDIDTFELDSDKATIVTDVTTGKAKIDHEIRKKNLQNAMKNVEKTTAEFLKDNEYKEKPDMRGNEQAKKIHLDERLFEDYITEGRKREEAEDETDYDLWTRVYNELDKDADAYDRKLNIVPREAGPRYGKLTSTYDGYIQVYADDVKKFKRGKIVADTYGLKYEVKENDRPQDKEYPHVMTIKVPEGKEFDPETMVYKKSEDK